MITTIRLDVLAVGERFRKDYGDLSELRDSLAQYGLIQPISVDQEGNLLAGGRRVAAAKELQWAEIPCVIRTVKGEVEAREIELVENIHRKDLTWQERARLEREIYRLKGNVRDAAEVMGESKSLLHNNLVLAEMIEQMPELAECKTASDAMRMLDRLQEKVAVAELRKRASVEVAEGEVLPTVARIYRFAENHYKIGDALEGLAALNPDVFGFAEVDPPYGIQLDLNKETPDYTEVAPDQYASFIEIAAKLVHRALAQNTHCIWWFGFQQYTTVSHALRVAGFEVDPIPGIWYKGDQGQTNAPNTRLASCYEPFLIAKKGRPYLKKQGRSNVFQFTPVYAPNKIHPTERPVELILELLETFTYPAQLVLSPFLGSGNTLLAAYRYGCAGLGWDLSQSLKDGFLLRIRDYAEAEASKETKDEPVRPTEQA